MNSLSICVIPGDGVGKEVTDCAIEVMDAAASVLGAPTFEFREHAAGYQSLLNTGESFPPSTLEAAKAADGVLMGAFAVAQIPQDAVHPLRALRRGLGIRASVRPSRVLPGVSAKAESMDLLVVREVTEGFYSGVEYVVGEDSAFSVRVITREASMNTARVAFEAAERRRGKVTVVHKSSALPVTDGLFLECAQAVAATHPGVTLEKRNVDACAMELISKPEEFDVILTTNCFGDIISDVAAALSGGIGIAPSGCIGDKFSYFEPVHGTAPRRVGLGTANPIGAIRSAAMMLDHIGAAKMAKHIDDAVNNVLGQSQVVGGTSTSAEVTAAVIRAMRA